MKRIFAIIGILGLSAFFGVSASATCYSQASAENEVANLVESVYNYFNQIRAYYMETPPEELEDMKWESADDRFGTREWRELRLAVDALDRGDDDVNFLEINGAGPYDAWVYDCFEGDVHTEGIEVAILGDGMAQVDFLLRDATTITPVPLRWQLRLEDGVWKVSDIIFVRDDFDVLDAMREYTGGR